MARDIWKGHISFGLVSIPVSLATAEISNDLRFNLLDKKDHAPVGFKRYNKNSGKEVDWGSVVKGFELDDGKMVIIEKEDFERANPKATHTIEIQNFVDKNDIPVQYFEKPYYLSTNKTGQKAYKLLYEVLKKSNKVAIAKFVMRGKEHLCSLIPGSDFIVLEIMRFAHELREEEEVDSGISEKLSISQQELRIAEQLVEGMTAEWNPEVYKDTYRDDLLKLIETKSKKGKIPNPKIPAVSQTSKVVDLMPLLKKSLEDRIKKEAETASSKKSGKKKKTAKPAGRVPSRKSSPRKTG